MNLFKSLFGKSAIAPPSAVEPQSMVIAKSRPFVNQAALDSASLRKGMWVFKDGQIGIITGCRIDALVEVTLIKPDGTTHMMLDANDKAVPEVVLSSVSNLRRATISEIPEPRRPSLDALQSMGYTQ